MTFDDYIKSPSGKGVMGSLQYEAIRNSYMERLNKIMVRENGGVYYKLYETPHFYLCHIKVPSEAVDKFYYDVVIEIEREKIQTRDLSHNHIKVYSNDPAFCFRFCYAFNKEKMFIDDLSDKMPKAFYRDKPVETNPEIVIGHVKSLYFAYLMMVSKGLFKVIKYESEKQPFAWNILKSNIMSAEEKIKLRQEAQEEIDKAKRKNRPAKTTRDDIITPGVKNNDAESRSNLHHVRMSNNVSMAKTISKSDHVAKKTKIVGKR